MELKKGQLVLVLAIVSLAKVASRFPGRGTCLQKPNEDDYCENLRKQKTCSKLNWLQRERWCDITCGICIDTPNLASGKPTYQSPTEQEGVASRAVDGKTNKCTRAIKDRSSPWWQVDLEKGAAISKVTLYIQDDQESQRLISNAQVWISSAIKMTMGNSKLCGAVGNANGVTKIEVECGEKIAGRYVLVLGKKDVLSLCEVQVWDASICKIPCLNGQCKNGQCVCKTGWTGVSCAQRVCDPACVNGECINGKCQCIDGWIGEACDKDNTPVAKNCQMVLGDMNYCLDLFKTAGESCHNDPMKAEMYGRCDAACQQIHAKEKLKICEGEYVMKPFGTGYCKEGFMGWDGKVISSVDACNEQCLEESTCNFAAYHPGEKKCRRFDGDFCHSSTDSGASAYKLFSKTLGDDARKRELVQETLPNYNDFMRDGAK